MAFDDARQRAPKTFFVHSSPQLSNAHGAPDSARLL
jgi:hypothetical protein